MNKEYQTVKGELCWAKVHEIRELIAKNEADLEEKKKQLTKQAEVLSTVTGECKRLELNVDEINAQMDEEKAKYHKQEQEMDKIKEQIESLKANKKDLDAELRKKGGESNTLVKEKKFLTTEIDRLSGASSLEEKDRKEQERQHRLDTLFKKKNELDEKIKIEGTTREYQDAGIREESEKIKSLMIDHNEISQAIEDKLREISSLKHQPPILAMFGNKIPQLDREIKMMEKEFNKMPIGPVGQYVKLEGEAGVNGQLGKLIETELTRSHLTAYLTDNDRDRRVLQQIMDRVYGSDKRGKPRIFTSRFIGRRHENLNRPDRQSYRVVLDYLKIEDNNVFNHLVDQKSIEMVLVCKTQDEAKRLMSRVSDVPKNVMYTITYDMYRFFPAKTSSSYRSYFMDSFTGNGLLKATMKSHIQDMNSELELLKAQLDEKNRDITQSKNSRKSFECEKTRAMQQIVLYRKQLQQCSSEISKVKSEEDTDTSDLESYRMKLKTKEEKLEDIKRSIEIKKEEKNKINEQIKRLESNLMSMKNELFSQQDNEMNDMLSKSLVEKNQQLRNKTTEKKNKEKIVDRLKTQIDATEQKMRKNREQEDQYKVAAIKLIPDEIKPKKSSTDLNARAVNLKKRLQNDEDPNIESIVTEYEEFNRRLLQYKNEIDKVEGMIKTLHEMKKDREDRMIMIKNTLDTLVKRKFNSMIKKFSTNLGSQIFLRIDHKTKKLFFAFKKGDQTYKSSDHVSTLSGGEKSYTQMCLICSLWDIMEPPFRCLDEWDVFLDAVNRKAISQELLTFSLKNPNKQFIFISPQGACDLQNLPHNKVLVTEFKKNSS